MMIFYLYSSRFCRNLSCLPVSKIFTITYSSSAVKVAKKVSSQISPRSTVPEKYHTKYIDVNTIIPTKDTVYHDPSNAQNTITDAIKKENQIVQEEEWKQMKVDSSKIYKYCLMLSKIRLTSLVVITTMGGYALAPAAFDMYSFLLCAAGTGLVSATANSINQFFEVPFDAQMSRTKNRVLVRGYLTPAHAITFAMISGIAGLSILYFEVNGLTAALGGANLFLYTLCYTPMKRVSILNTWIGSIVGAIPPLMGWAACVGDITAPGAWIMPGILYAWQFPHFNALSWNLRPDYSRAGYRMMAVTNPDLCRRTALRYTTALMGLSYLAPVFDVTNWWFALESTPLNAYFLFLAWQFNKDSDSATSRKLFRFSLVHLPALVILMLFNKKHWGNAKEKNDSTSFSKTREVVLNVFTKYVTAAK